MSLLQVMAGLVFLASCAALGLSAIGVSIWWIVISIRQRTWPQRQAVIGGGVCLAVPAVALGLSFLALERLDPFNQAAFNAQVWKTCVQDQTCRRGGMTRSLLRDYLRPGMTKAEVLNLLGPPDRERDSSGDSLRVPGRGNGRLIDYNLGYCSGMKLDEDFLSVVFDSTDRMVEAYHWQS